MDAQNPLGIIGIDHLEFTNDQLKDGKIYQLFKQLGFIDTYKNQAGDEILLSQGQVRFLLVNKKEGHPREYFLNHGEGVSKISFLVEDCEQALSTAIKRGGKLINEVEVKDSEHGVYKTAAIQGIGDVLNEFVERPLPHFRADFLKIENDQAAKKLDVRVARIDHLTNNVPAGQMDFIAKFYADIFGFVETRIFDIQGEKTGLNSKVMQLANGAIIIPINEPKEAGGKDQIQEYLDLHKGPGVQHIALTTPDIIKTVAQLQDRDIKFLKIPDTYYEDIPNRGFKVEEDINILRERQILVDGDEDGYLLQMFSETYIGPLFFEYIQRKNHDGFGEGNFNALFSAIEREQQRRGVL